MQDDIESELKSASNLNREQNPPQGTLRCFQNHSFMSFQSEPHLDIRQVDITHPPPCIQTKTGNLEFQDKFRLVGTCTLKAIVFIDTTKANNKRGKTNLRNKQSSLDETSDLSLRERYGLVVLSPDAWF